MDKKYELYYVNYETKNGTQKEFEKVTEDLNLWDIEPILGTLTEINEFVPKLIKTSGRLGVYYIHQCLVVIDPKKGNNIICLYY